MEELFYTMLYLAFTQIKRVEVNQTLLSGINLKELYLVSQFHGVTAIVFDALENAGAFTTTDNQELNEIRATYFKKYREAKEKSVRKNLLMDVERQKLFSYMDENAIWHMPLKGVVLKDYYPKAGQRQMADNDILFDKAYQKEIRDWFEARGYEVVSYDSYNHDVYEKEPVYNFEMHTSLYSKAHKEGWEEYYQNIKTRLVSDGKQCHEESDSQKSDSIAVGKKKNGENSYEEHFTNEDFYVYFISHAYKHYDGSGTGIKFLLDLYLYLEKHEATMDWHYIKGEINKLRMTEFEQSSRELVKSISKIVDELAGMNQNAERLSVKQQEILGYFFGSGTYGTMNNRVKKKMNSYDTGNLYVRKIKYLTERLFPNQEFMKQYSSIFGKYKILLPVGWGYRIIRGCFTHSGELLKEVKTVVKIKNTKTKETL